MNCTECAAPLAAGQKFCSQCGRVAGVACPSCRAAIALGAAFCSQCGNALPAPTQLVADGRDKDGERRQLTVLFADLVGATALSHRLDPEAFRGLLDVYQNACATAVARFGGQIKQFLGDGVLAYFGFPQAHENDAERAVLAGLAIVDAVRTRAGGAGQHTMHVRVGIHTGIVVVGGIAAGPDQGAFAFGDVPNVAARLQAEAAVDTVCIARPTRALLGGRFTTRSLGVRPMKGVDDDVELFVVDGVVGSEDARSTYSRLVGRDAEIAQLEVRWTQASSGAGQAVTISGEAGLGKSRLVTEFRRRTGDGIAWRTVRGTPYNENSAFQPVIDALNAQLASGTDRAAAIRSALAGAGRDDAATAALVGELLGSTVANTGLVDLSPAQRRRRLIDALVAWIIAPATTRPTVVVFEDVHWFDASTIELIGELLDRIASLPVLVVATFRPDFVPPWKSRAHGTTITLSKLSADETGLIVRALTGGRALPDDVAAEILFRCDGVPLFAEEITKTVLESGRLVERDGSFERAPASVSRPDVPATLRDSLTARLDRLGPAKGTAQLAAVLGRDFDYAVLLAVAGLEDAALEDRLDVLVRADILQQAATAPRTAYTFKHALIQEAAYDTLLKSVRTAHHATVAKTYVARFPDAARARPELVARHFVRAGDPLRSARWWTQAIDIANARQGHREAIGHFDEVMTSLQELPDTERPRHELSLRLAVGTAMLAALGFADPRSAANYDRASDLAEVVGAPAERFTAAWGGWQTSNASGRIFEAARRSDRLVVLCSTLADTGYLLQAHHSRWTNGAILGRIDEAMTDTACGMALYDVQAHAHHKHTFGGHDPGVCALSFGAAAAWQAGQDAVAAQRIAFGMSLALELDHATTTATCYLHGSMLAILRGELDLAIEQSARLAGLIREFGINQWLGVSQVCGGAAATRGPGGTGIASIEAGLGSLATIGMQNFSTLLAVIAAEAYLRAGEGAKALALLDAASVQSDRTGVGLHRPEIERLRTRLRLEGGDISRDEAVTAYLAAAEMARAQGARTLLARIVASLEPLVGDGPRASARRDFADHVVRVPAVAGETPEIVALRAVHPAG